jgi:hypothetical protein
LPSKKKPLGFNPRTAKKKKKEKTIKQIGGTFGNI